MERKQSAELIKDTRDFILPVIGFEPIVVRKTEGAHILDMDGNRYLDLNGGQFCSVLDKSLDDLLEGIKGRNIHTNTALLSEEAIGGLRDLNRIAPEMNPQSIILSTGAEAIEFGLRYAKKATGKDGLICFDKGYHGLTLGAQSATYGGVYAQPIQPSIYSIPVPQAALSDDEVEGIIANLETLIADNDDIACVLLEPIVSVGGMYVQERPLLLRIREFCDTHGLLLIFDECQTGFGRTGTWFYYQQVGVVPDVLVTAKGLGLGFPVAAVMVRESVIKDYPMDFIHYSSHQNDPFGGYIISYAVDRILRNGILESVCSKGDYLFQRLERLSESMPRMSRPRGKGLMIGFDLSYPGIQDYRKLSAAFRRELLDQGVIIQATNGGRTIRCLPSYQIVEADIDFFIDKLSAVLESFDYEEFL